MAELGTCRTKPVLTLYTCTQCIMYLLGSLSAGPLSLLWSVFVVRILQLVEVSQVLCFLPERGLLLISQRLPDLAEILSGGKY